MRRFTQILILLVIVILILPLFLPNKLEVEVEKEFDFPTGMIFEEFNNMKEFSEWNPWTSAESDINHEFYAPYRGMGAGYKWSTKEKNSVITIQKSDLNKQIEYEVEGLDLGKNSQMNVEFNSVNPNKTNVKWHISSEELGYFSRYYNYFTSKKLKEKLQLGLNKLEENLKTSVLTPEQANSLSPGMIKSEMFEGMKLITVMNETSLEEDEVKMATEESFGLLYSYLIDFLKISPNKVGEPISYYEFVDTAANKAKFYCGYPITESVKLGEGMELISLPAAETLICIHKGSYKTINETIGKMNEYAEKNKLKLENSYWEEYQNDPESTKNEADLLTKIYIPIQK